MSQPYRPPRPVTGIALLLLFTFIKAQRLRWLGHVERIPEERDVKKIYKWKLIAPRPIGRPKIRWMDNVMKDIQEMKIVNWKR
jgi:hypothetical protein